jgi:hypothetical protein
LAEESANQHTNARSYPHYNYKARSSRLGALLGFRLIILSFGASLDLGEYGQMISPYTGAL